MQMQVQELRSADAAAGAAAAEIARRARVAVAERGSFSLAVSGGRTPWSMIAALGDHEVPWERVTLFQVDERIGPAADPLRNLSGLVAALPAGCPARVVPMPVEGDDLAAACAAYARSLPEALDLIHLGLGADGHTASLIPGDPVLEVDDALVAVTGVYQDRRRMTLTYPVIGRARVVLWLVTGADKRSALDQLLAGDASIPAGRVHNDDQVLFCDADAGGWPTSGTRR